MEYNKRKEREYTALGNGLFYGGLTTVVASQALVFVNDIPFKEGALSSMAALMVSTIGATAAIYANKLKTQREILEIQADLEKTLESLTMEDFPSYS